MRAAEKYGVAESFRFDRYTVTMTHPDALIALTSGSGQIDAHFTSPPFHQREAKDQKVHTVLTSDDIANVYFEHLSTVIGSPEEEEQLARALQRYEAEQAEVAQDKAAPPA